MGKPNSSPPGISHHLQVLVALCSQLEATAEAIRKSGEFQRLTPQEEALLRITEMQGNARCWHRWALTSLAKSNLPEVRHG